MTRRSVEDVPATAHFSFLYGAFRLSDWEIPFFASTVTLEEAAQYLRLTTDIPGAEDIAWKLEELYQRDVDWPRVDSRILPYLRNRAEPQFFNSIIIALLPFDQRTGLVLDGFDGDRDWNPPPLADPDRFVKELDIGPIRLGFWEAWELPQDSGFRTGELRWNTKEVFGVAIDGQHRLAAIKQYVDGASKVRRRPIPDYGAGPGLDHFEGT
jgi:hypothetical protein